MAYTAPPGNRSSVGDVRVPEDAPNRATGPRPPTRVAGDAQPASVHRAPRSCGSRASCPSRARVARSGCSQRNDADRQRIAEHASQRAIAPVLVAGAARRRARCARASRRSRRATARTGSRRRRRRRSTSPPQQSWLPAIIRTGTPASTTSASAASVRNPRRGMTVRHSNQNSNRSPLIDERPGVRRDVAQETR